MTLLSMAGNEDVRMPGGGRAGRGAARRWNVAGAKLGRLDANACVRGFDMHRRTICASRPDNALQYMTWLHERAIYSAAVRNALEYRWQRAIVRPPSFDGDGVTDREPTVRGAGCRPVGRQQSDHRT